MSLLVLLLSVINIASTHFTSELSEINDVASGICIFVVKRGFLPSPAPKKEINLRGEARKNPQHADASVEYILVER